MFVVKRPTVQLANFCQFLGADKDLKEVFNCPLKEHSLLFRSLCLFERSGCPWNKKDKFENKMQSLPASL